MASPFAVQSSLLPALLFIVAVVAASQTEGCDCEAKCAEVVARQCEEIESLKAEVRTLRSGMDPEARRTASCLLFRNVDSDAGVEALRGCRTIGTLFISGSGVTSLAGLSNVESAERININRCIMLEALDGLEKLAHVGFLAIEGAVRLRSIAALQSLEDVGTFKLHGNSDLQSLTGLDNLERVGTLEIRGNDHLQSLTGLDRLVQVGPMLEIMSNNRLQSLTGLDRLVQVGSLSIVGNAGIQSLTGLGSLARVDGRLYIYLTSQLRSLAGLERLGSAYHIRFVGHHLSGGAGIQTLAGLERLTEVGTLELVNVRSLESVAGLGSLTRAYAGGICIDGCSVLHSLEGLGALRTTSQLTVQKCRLTYLGGPFATGASASVVRIDDLSWPRCTTVQERLALLSVAGDKNNSFVPEAVWGPECGRYFATSTCTKGQHCSFSLAGHAGKGIFVSGRFTGCGACSERHPRGNVTESGTVDLGYSLWDEEPGLHSVCRCGGGVGPVGQLLLRGPWLSAVQVCSRGSNCTFRVEGEALERTDRVVVMSNCSSGNPSSGFVASWTAENAYLLHDPATWHAAQPKQYQVCWRAQCRLVPDGPTCPAPEDSYFHVGEMELFGAYPRQYKLVLGGDFPFSVQNIGYGVSDGDWMRLRRACGEADGEEIGILPAVSSAMVFDFGTLTEERIQAGRYHLCWCRGGAECNAGSHFRADAGIVQILCPAGRELLDSRRCESCPAGKHQPEAGLGPCLKCPTGHFSRGGNEVCEACPGGKFAGLAGSSACVACPGWQSAAADASGCTPDATVVVLLALFCLCVSAFCTVLVHGIRRRLLVVDVSLLQHQTILTTSRPHCLANFGSASFPVTLHGTGHPGLDSPVQPFRARVRDAVRLELLTWASESISLGRLDTSMGTLTVAFPNDFLHRHWLFVPIVVCLPVLLAVVGALCGLLLWGGLATEVLLGSAAAVVACTTTLSTLCRPRLRATPLGRRLSEFQLKLAQHPSSGRRCERGPKRAIAIGNLHELLQFFRDFIRDRTTYFVSSNILQQLTKPQGISYAELAGAEQVEWFVCHFWGTPFEHFCMSLRRHAETVCGQRDWTRLRYWAWFCCNNQHCIEEKFGGDWSELSFYLALKSGHCRGTCMVLDDQALPLTRIWCIFELLQTFRLSDRRADFEGLHLCTSGGVLSTCGGNPEVATELVEKLAEVDLETAQATSEDDRAMIRTQMLDTGSFATLNCYMRREVRSALVCARQYAVQHFDALLARLDQPTESAPAMETLLDRVSL